MIAVNAGSLFHYTDKIDKLLKILENGIRYSYSPEEFDNDIIFAFEDGGKPHLCRLVEDANTPRVILMPMVSFCDIPLSRTAKHRLKYGKYCIGLDKTTFLKHWKGRISPVTYYPNPDFREYYLYLSDLLNTVGNYDREELSAYCNQITDGKTVIDGAAALAKDDKARAFIRQDSGFIKLKCFTSQVLAVTKPLLSSKGAANYDDREWRSYTLNGLNGDDWGKWEIMERGKHKERKSQLDDILTNEKKAYIRVKSSIIPKVISYIIVSRENERKMIIEYLSDTSKMVFGKSLTENQRMSLISKITSFERIGKDF